MATTIPDSVWAEWEQIVHNQTTVEVRGPALYILCAVFGSLATVVVAVRIWLRVFVQRHTDASDWFTIVALVQL